MADYSADARRKAKAKGNAMPNPSGGPPRFPINNAADLANAIRLAGNAKGDPAKVRAFIKRRAAALGLSAKVPAGW